MKNQLWVAVIAVLLLAGGCTAAETNSGAAAQTDAVSVYITCNGATAAVDGAGASAEGNTVTITAGGVYGLSGALDGQVIIDAGKKDTVELVLDGITITSSTGAAIYAEKAETVIITLADGTENTLTEAYAGTQDDTSGAALFVNDDLTIRGDGTLMVYGNVQNGIATRDNLVIESGTLTVQAQNNGIRGRDSVTVRGGWITIDAGNDGIQSDNTGDAEKGWIVIGDGVCNIVAAHDGIQAQSMLTVSGGEITILAGGGYAAQNSSGGESAKALKSAGSISITGGTVSANGLDDAVHAADAVTVSGGELTLLSGDDGIHADGTVNITDGTVEIENSYEGIEGTVVNIGGGTVSLLAADDGINAADMAAAGRSDPTGGFGGWGDSGDTGLQVNITGGIIRINAYGDGVDSNGTITMTGGELYVSGPVSSANGALDYDRSFLISGGVLVAAGAAGMAQTPGADSAQPSVMVYFTQQQAAGPAYILMDGDGNPIISYTPEKEFQSIVFSSPELITGGSYCVCESTDGTLENAVRLYDFTISDTVTSVGDTVYGAPAQDRMMPPDGRPQPDSIRRP